MGRDWGSPWIPERLDLQAMARLAPQTLARPRWLLNFAKTRRLPDLTAPSLAEPGLPAPTFFGAYYEWMQTPPATWEDVAWLRRQWDGPFLLKGICRVDDARRAVDAGATAISVSNHGGNNLDGTPAPIRVLPAIAEAVGDQVEVLLDGGIRRGGDVVKALALGARAVLIGRAYLWGLAANGQAGVENVLDILRGGIDSAMRSRGCATRWQPPRTWPRWRSSAGTGGTAVVDLPCDVRSPADVSRLVDAANPGRLVAAVAVAGVIGAEGPAWEQTPADLDRDLSVNLHGVANLARATVPHLLHASRGRGRGRFVAVVSSAGERGLPRLASYVAAKHAALGYIRALAADLAPSGVTANAVLPGSTDTTLLGHTATVYELAHATALAQHQRIGRLLEPAEVAAAVLWLCSPAASAMTGTALRVDGGFTG